ncbi:hypothetical protein DFH09DRAFT_1362975 [Mycena vulgaris]|nr:hypothetical protein DFH09DRAFT_1362975 [Mycena vulgaris]
MSASSSPSTRRSSTSASASASVTPSSSVSATSSSAPFSVSQTFTANPMPPALPTSGPPPDPNANSGPQSPAQLYLYTFLATLILLLGVSSAIVIDLRKKPRMWDAYLAPLVNVPVGSGGVGGGGGDGEKDEWEAIMSSSPFSSLRVCVCVSLTDPPSPTIRSVVHTALALALARPASFHRLPSLRFFTSRAHPPASANALNGKAAEQEEVGLEQPRVCGAVLIAMPVPPPASSNPTRAAAPDVGLDADGESQLPELEVGMAFASEKVGSCRRARASSYVVDAAVLALPHGGGEARGAPLFFRPRDQLIERAAALARSSRVRDPRDREGNVSRLLVPPLDAPGICELIPEGLLFSG